MKIAFEHLHDCPHEYSAFFLLSGVHGRKTKVLKTFYSDSIGAEKEIAALVVRSYRIPEDDVLYINPTRK